MVILGELQLGFYTRLRSNMESEMLEEESSFWTFDL